MEDLWKIRRRKRMTVAQLSSKSGVPARRIREYEAGTRDIRSDDLPRLARALYVGEWEIKLRSRPIPPKLAGEQEPSRPTAPAKPAKKAKAKTLPKPKKAPPPPAPARPSQLAHLQGLLKRLGLEQAAVEAAIGKRFSELTRREASRLLGELQQRIAAERPPKEKGKRRRPYLPESVDEFELRYLTEQQEAGRLIDFTLFNGQKLRGRIVGFGPYSITIRQEDGEEVTMQKLAIAYYRVLSDGGEVAT